MKETPAPTPADQPIPDALPAPVPPVPAKYIFVTGGVASSLGKGIISASLAKLLQARGLRVTIQKFDPYINIDPGTLNPYEHGECYVTDDGAETDLDLGHYERFLNRPTSQANNVTTGRIYHEVITRERQGAYLGKTVQVVPHITDEIKRRMLAQGQTGDYDVVITEIGGCVGDIESLPFIESVRQLRWELPDHDSLVIHLTLVPFLKAAGELKTKPTQHSVKQLTEAGVQPDILVCRSEYPIPPEMRQKIALFCNVKDTRGVFDLAGRRSPSTQVPHPAARGGARRPPGRIAQQAGAARLRSSAGPRHRGSAFLGRLKNPTAEVKIARGGQVRGAAGRRTSRMNEALHSRRRAANDCKRDGCVPFSASS